MTPSSRCRRSRYSAMRASCDASKTFSRSANPRSRLGADMRLDGRAFGQWIVRQPRFAELERQRTAPRDLHGVRQRLGNVGKQLGHLLRRTQVLRLGVSARAVGIGELRAVGNADARLVRFEIAGARGSARRWWRRPGCRSSGSRRRSWRPAIHRRRARGAAVRGSSDRRTSSAIRAPGPAHRPRGRW